MINRVLIADSVSDVVGKITPPVNAPGFSSGSAEEGIVRIINVVLQVVLVIAGLFTLLNFVLAGYHYMMAGGDSKKVQEANLRMTYTIVGLILIVITPLLAAIIGIIVFKRWDAILNPQFTKLGP